MSVSVAITEDKDTDALLSRLDITMRTKAVKQALRAGGGVVRKEARRRAPRSKKTGTSDAWSERTRSDRAGEKPHWKTVGLVVRDYGETFVVVVGAQYPAGALGHLIEGGHELVAWGQPLPQRVEGRPYLEPAADTTKSEQGSAFINKLTQIIDAAAT